MTQIVVLDGYTLNPGDLDWTLLHELGECKVYERSTSDEVVNRASDAEIILTNKVGIDTDLISQLPKLKYIGVTATGYNIIDLDPASKAGIVVTNVPDYTTEAVAQMTFALLLEVTQHVGHHAQTVREGRWSHSQDFCYWDYPLIELNDLTMGIIGYGNVGKAVAKIARSFGMHVIATNRRIQGGGQNEVQFQDLDTVCRESDVISLHCPLTEDTTHLIDTYRLSIMKKSAILINTSRGGLINESALVEALENKNIRAACIDVMDPEPPSNDHPLLSLKNCYITPHISWATHTARSRLLNLAIANVKVFLDGLSQNVVNLN